MTLARTANNFSKLYKVTGRSKCTFLTTFVPCLSFAKRILKIGRQIRKLCLLTKQRQLWPNCLFGPTSWKRINLASRGIGFNFAVDVCSKSFVASRPFCPDVRGRENKHVDGGSLCLYFVHVLRVLLLFLHVVLTC